MKYSVQNPILRGFHPDPCMICVDGTYYVATSTFEYFPGVKISASEDLANWRTAAYPLNNLSLLDMRGDVASTGIWAPALSYADGMFWLIFTNQRQCLDGHLKDTENYLTTCKTNDGEWSKPVRLNGSGFDPSLFHDNEENACRVLLKITYDDSRFRLERIASLPDEGAVWIRLCVDHADGKFLYSVDGEAFLPAGDPFDASKLSDEYNRPLGFTGPFAGIGCQDFSDWSKTADFKYFRYTEKTTE